MNVLISLYPGYGLGDAVQMSAVLRHIAKHRPHWRVDYRAPEGQACVGVGIVANTFTYGQPNPTEHYDAEFQITLHDRWYGWTDRPNTNVAQALQHFDIPWDAECGRYQVNVSPDMDRWAKRAVTDDAVAFHYQGETARDKKDLTEHQSIGVLDDIWVSNHTPFILGKHISNGYNAEVNTAIIKHCRAFVGIDSGPAKCASATDTPSLVVWTGHHPARFHDPAPNTMHLVPRGYHCLDPVNYNEGVVKWFEANYNVRAYDRDMTYQVGKWLREVLK